MISVGFVVYNANATGGKDILLEWPALEAFDMIATLIKDCEGDAEKAKAAFHERLEKWRRRV